MRSARRSPFVIAGLVGGVALLILGAAAPGGETWRYLELPRHITFIAIVLGVLVAAKSTNVQRAVVPLLGTPAIACVWDVVQYKNGDAITGIVTTLAPWLAGGVYAALAALATTAKNHIDARRRAGAWLIGVGVIALALTLANRSWLTLENLSQNGTFRSSVAWPDTKKISLVIACIATAVGAAIAWVKQSDEIPRATAREKR